MPENPKISVLIPAFNEQGLISEAIASVNRSFEQLSLTSYEIVVCDNNSTDQTAHAARESGAKVVFEPHNQIARARNTAARHARGEWLMFMDADTHLNAQVLAAAIEKLSSGKVCGGGALLQFDREVAGIARFLSRVWRWASPRFGLAGGAFIFSTRDAWQAVDGFDEELYAAEDVSFSRRLKKWGKRNGMRFLVLTDPPILTSGRKLDSYGSWRIVRELSMLALPGALKSRSKTRLWYER